VTPFIFRQMFQPAVTICRDYGGGGNRTRVGCQPELQHEQEFLCSDALTAALVTRGGRA